MFLLLSQPERDNKLLSPKRKTKALDLTIRAHPETEGFGAFTLTGAPPFLPCSSHSQTLGHLKSLKGSPHTDNPPCDLQLGFTNYLKFSFLNKMPCKSCRRKKSQKQTFFSCCALRDTASLTGRLATERVRSVPRPALSLLPSAARLPVPLLVPMTVSHCSASSFPLPACLLFYVPLQSQSWPHITQQAVLCWSTKRIQTQSLHRERHKLVRKRCLQN